MLIIEVFTNYEKIDEICIQNTKETEGERTVYKIVKPEGIETKILHKRDLGYMPLLKEAIEIISIHKHLKKKE